MRQTDVNYLRTRILIVFEETGAVTLGVNQILSVDVRCVRGGVLSQEVCEPGDVIFGLLERVRCGKHRGSRALIGLVTFPDAPVVAHVLQRVYHLQRGAFAVPASPLFPLVVRVRFGRLVHVVVELLLFWVRDGLGPLSPVVEHCMCVRRDCLCVRVTTGHVDPVCFGKLVAELQLGGAGAVHDSFQLVRDVGAAFFQQQIRNPARVDELLCALGRYTCIRADCPGRDGRQRALDVVGLIALVDRGRSGAMDARRLVLDVSRGGQTGHLVGDGEIGRLFELWCETSARATAFARRTPCARSRSGKGRRF